MQSDGEGGAYSSSTVTSFGRTARGEGGGMDPEPLRADEGGRREVEADWCTFCAEATREGEAREEEEAEGARVEGV